MIIYIQSLSTYWNINIRYLKYITNILVSILDDLESFWIHIRNSIFQSWAQFDSPPQEMAKYTHTFSFKSKSVVRNRREIL